MDPIQARGRAGGSRQATSLLFLEHLRPDWLEQTLVFVSLFLGGGRSRCMSSRYPKATVMFNLFFRRSREEIGDDWCIEILIARFDHHCRILVAGYKCLQPFAISQLFHAWSV